jgi:hypothetical protein
MPESADFSSDRDVFVSYASQDAAVADMVTTPQGKARRISLSRSTRSAQSPAAHSIGWTPPIGSGTPGCTT